MENYKSISIFAIVFVLLTGLAVGLSLEEVNLEDDLAETEDEVYETVDAETYSYILEIDRNNWDSAAVESLGVNIDYKYSVVEAVNVEGPAEVVEDLDSLSFVHNVVEDREVKLINPTPEVQEERDESYGSVEEYDGDNVRIAVLDTGIDNNHAHFENLIIDNQDFTGDGPHDVDGHGSHVASIAAGQYNDFEGVAPEAYLKNIKVLDDDGQGSVSDVLAGIDYGVDKEVEVMVLSLGAEIDQCDGSDMLSRAVDSAVDEGVAVTVSAGNSGSESNTITSPGCSRRGLTVGATDFRDEDIASYSSRGSTADGRVKPDIVAPGTQIWGADTETGNQYTRKSGTSMAAPFVGGGLALMIEENPDLTVEEYFEAMTYTATDLEVNEMYQGNGRVDLTASLEYVSNEVSEEDGNDEQEESDSTDLENNGDGGSETGQEENRSREGHDEESNGEESGFGDALDGFLEEDVEGFDWRGWISDLISSVLDLF